MTVHLWNQQLSYISVPKCGCTSLKMFFYEISTGTPFYGGGFYGNVHKEFPTKSYSFLPRLRMRDHDKIAVVRDPVDRISSAYQSKVVNEECLKKPRVRSLLPVLGLSEEPSLGELLRRLRSYMLASRVVFWHFQKLSYFLGRQAAWFTRLFDISEMSELCDMVEERTGRSATRHFVNRSEEIKEKAPVSGADRAKILGLFKEDVTLFGRHFVDPASAG